MHIAIAGNIGAGKTTLTNMLSKHYGWETHFEDVEQNPYLNDFYEDMQRWSFNLQVYFLNSRFSQIQDIHSQEKTVIQDRTIYEDAYIFAPNLHSMGLMTTRDFENYFSLFNLMDSFVKAPDLLIYLRASIPTLVSHIQKRGRDYTKKVSDWITWNVWMNDTKHGFLRMIKASYWSLILTIITSQKAKKTLEESSTQLMVKYTDYFNFNPTIHG